MNEKSNPMPMMYKTIPAVAELNKVPGFDPLKFLRHKVSRKTNEEMLQLELPYQKLWFRLRHPQGRMKLTTLRITEQLAIMELQHTFICAVSNTQWHGKDHNGLLHAFFAKD